MCQQRMNLPARWVSSSIVLLFFVVSIAGADTAVIVGANIGNWFVTGYATNPKLSADAMLPVCLPPTGCPQTLITFPLPPLGSVDISPLLFGSGTAYVSNQAPADQAFPLVRTRLVNALDFGGAFALNRSVDIPVVLVSQLISVDLSTLNFGNVESAAVPLFCAQGAPCPFPIRSTLVLGNIMRTDDKPGEDLPVILELFDSSGNLVGSDSLTIGYEETVVIGDVAGTLGAEGNISLGQLRATRISGHALMWGILYTQDVGGNVSASAGVNLSP